jgi:cytochrome P450
MTAISRISRVPAPDFGAARQALLALRREGHILAALEALHGALGDIFDLPLPGFRSIMLVGPEANKFLLTDGRERFLWRSEGDPVTRLLRHGLLVVDGPFHDELRQLMTPALHRSLFEGFIPTMWQSVDRIADEWQDDAPIEMFAASRRIALLTIMEALLGADIGPDLDTLWRDILRAIHYISPGPWLLWPGMPRPGYRHVAHQVDTYIARLVARRRAVTDADSPPDLLGRLIASGMRDELIRDQALTLLIAGHDTSTALVAWSLYLLATHQDILARVQGEIDTVIGVHPPAEAHLRHLTALECVIKEVLRLYPPIHLGSRIAAVDLEFHGFHIPVGARVLYSIYLTHRDQRYWADPHLFDPDRFAAERAHERTAYTFLPFGGGPRNCIGAAFAQVEAKIALARILQRFAIRFVGSSVRPRMRATLEPAPGVLLEVRRRRPGSAMGGAATTNGV